MEGGGWRLELAAAVMGKDRLSRANLFLEGPTEHEGEEEEWVAVEGPRSKMVRPRWAGSESLRAEGGIDCALAKEALESTEADDGSLSTTRGFLSVDGEEGGDKAWRCSCAGGCVGLEVLKGCVHVCEGGAGLAGCDCTGDEEA